MNNYRTTARIIGLIYLGGFVVGIAGNGLLQSTFESANPLAIVSAHGLALSFGAILWLMAAVGDAAHGILMFPVLKQHNERAAVGYLCFRIIDAVFIALMVLAYLVQMPLGNEYLKAAASDGSSLQSMSKMALQASQSDYQLGMGALGLGGMILCYALYVYKMMPRYIAVWGFAGYAIITCGMVAAMMGWGTGLMASIPGGLWEVFFGCVLLFRGFRVSR